MIAQRPAFWITLVWPLLIVDLVIGEDSPVRNENPAEVSIQNSDGILTIQLKGNPLFRYRYAGVPYKPCVSEWYLEGIGNILRDSPPDHKHHHALMFAWNVNGVECWGEEGPVGRQSHRGFSRPPELVGSSVSFTEKLDWVGPDGRTVLLREDRQLSIPIEVAWADRFVIWRATFVGPDAQNDVTITGRKYLGLGIRFRESMDKGGRFVNANGETTVDTVNGSSARWCAFTAEASPGKWVTLAMLDDPRNVRHPAKWFAMNQPFAYLSGTIGLEDKPFVLKAGQRLTLCYGLAVWTGEPRVGRIEDTYRMWQDLVKSNQ